ncbi:MAG: efflux RND transporter periplasmic adaptor subunit [Caulobacterales bacterium]|uniref:efflux RND transporter periplasmic adaptor subunit n=1 Tax=Glycocaulis sp. TaxID=1969725 RepID=UPI003FA09E1C
MKKIVIAAAALIALAAIAFWAWQAFGTRSEGGLQVETAPIEARDLSRQVASTGAIAPLITVEVGSQLSGQILELAADFNDEVESGQILARLDPQTFETRVREARASLEVAQSQVSVSQANLTRARSEAREAERAFERARELVERGTYSQVQFDTAETARDSAQAGVLVAEANLRNARATLDQRQAALESAQVDLERTTIRSPIDGVVIDRQVDVGQTVAASLNAPVLFIIARDLSRIQIEAQVDESDIGQIAVGQPVTFEVDAFREREFTGEVRQVRLAALATQTVVTYTVVIEAENPGQRLLPGMTANVNIVTGDVEGALTVPATALRFQPRGAAESLVASESGNAGSGGARAGGNPMLARLLDPLELPEDRRAEAERALQSAFEEMRRAGPAGMGGAGGFPAMIQRALGDILTQEEIARLNTMMAEARAGGGARNRARSEVQRGTIWVQRSDGRIQSRPVLVGLSDGQYTQIMGEGLNEGENVVVRVREVR